MVLVSAFVGRNDCFGQHVFSLRAGLRHICGSLWSAMSRRLKLGTHRPQAAVRTVRRMAEVERKDPRLCAYVRWNLYEAEQKNPILRRLVRGRKS